jgi:hypothetical protein
MNDRDQEMREAMAELAAARGPATHPDPDELAAYHAAELPPERERRIQDHLAACRECAGLLLDLDGLADPETAAGSGLAGKEAVWQRLRQEIQPAPGKDVFGAAPVTPIRRAGVSSPRWLHALAASLLIATVGLSLWVAALRRTVDELSRPQPNAPLLDLYSGVARGEGSGRPALTVPADARLFTLILNPAGRRSTRYRVVIERAAGGEVWSGELEPNPFGSLSLTLSRRALGPGDYRIRLLAEGGELIEEYALRVEGL